MRNTLSRCTYTTGVPYERSKAGRAEMRLTGSIGQHLAPDRMTTDCGSRWIIARYYEFLSRGPPVVDWS